MKVRVRMRGPESGGAPGGTPELYFGDPDGIVVQLQDPTYCGGAGPLGSVCSAGEPAPSKGLLALKDLSHFTVSVSDAQRSNKFYQELFGFGIRSYQGPTAPTLAVGPTVGFLMFTGGGGGGRAGAPPAAPRPASINHVCMNMENFNVERVQKALESVGIKPRDAQAGPGPVGPMRHYVSMRMENRGGAKDGTPELYFTDPDGLLIQLQDVSYCGGGGYLGNECPAVK
jgi:catechol 2,3-dioxygenase-like lactoylglutathione lyase family enzyme